MARIISLRNNRVSFPQGWFGPAPDNDNSSSACAGVAAFCDDVGMADAQAVQAAYLVALHGAGVAASDGAQAGFKAMMAKPHHAGGVEAVTAGAIAGLAQALDGLLADVRASGDPRHLAYVQRVLNEIMARHQPGHNKSASML